jgi:phage/plasmid-like protein (TIGR03299 family)
MPAVSDWADGQAAVREVPWLKQQDALILDGIPSNWDDAWKAAGIDWEVAQVPVTYQWDGATIEDPSIRLNIRKDTGAVLGRVTKDYQVMQNAEAFSFLSKLIGGGVQFETAGTLHEGRMVYVMVRLPEVLEVAGDQTGIYGFLTNSHSGWAKGKASVTAQRFVCRNIHDSALAAGLPSVSWSHVGDTKAQLAEAAELMSLTGSFTDKYKAVGDALGGVKFTERKLENVLKELYPISDAWSERKQNNAKDHRNSIMYLWREGETCNELANAPHTAWTALQAVTEYVEHGLPTSDDEKLPRAEQVIARSFGDPKGIKTKATKLIAERAEVSLA